MFQYAAQTVVAPFVEGRYRLFSFHSSGSVGNTVPGVQSALSRRHAADTNLHSPAFMARLCSTWSKTRALIDLLMPIFPIDVLEPLTYYQRVQKVYGADVSSQFTFVPELVSAIKAWSIADQKRAPRWEVRESACESLRDGYIKSRCEAGGVLCIAWYLMQMTMGPVS